MFGIFKKRDSFLKSLFPPVLFSVWILIVLSSSSCALKEGKVDKPPLVSKDIDADSAGEEKVIPTPYTLKNQTPEILQVGSLTLRPGECGHFSEKFPERIQLGGGFGFSISLKSAPAFHYVLIPEVGFLQSLYRLKESGYCGQKSLKRDFLG